MESFCIVERNDDNGDFNYYILEGHVRQTGRPPKWCIDKICMLDFAQEMMKLTCGSVRINFERYRKTQYYLHSGE